METLLGVFSELFFATTFNQAVFTAATHSELIHSLESITLALHELA